MTPLVEDVSRYAVLIFYSAAFIMALVAFLHTRLWARKTSTVAMMSAAAGWLYFYTFIANTDLSTAPTIVLWSRIAGYNTATMLFLMGLVIWRADKYGIAVALSRNHE